MISHTISAYELLIIFLQVIDDYSYFCTINNTVLDKNLCLLVSLRLSPEYTLSQLLFFFLFDQSVLLKTNFLNTEMKDERTMQFYSQSTVRMLCCFWTMDFYKYKKRRLSSFRIPWKEFLLHSPRFWLFFIIVRPK